MNLRENKFTIILLILYKIVLEFLYIVYLSPLYSYAKLETNLNITKCLISYSFFILLIYNLPVNKGRPSTYLFYILFLIIFIPFSSYYWLNNQSTVFFIIEALAFLIIELMLKKIVINTFYTPVKPSKKKLNGLLYLYIIISLFCILRVGGIDFRVLDFDKIYEVRFENDISFAVGYLINWCCKAVMPLLLIIFLLLKKKFLVCLVCFMQILCFLAFGFKAFIISLVLFFAIYFLINHYDKFMQYFIIGLIMANVFSTMFYLIFDNKDFLQIFTYRTLFIPAQGQFEYFDFFQLNEFLFFSEGIIGKILGLKYCYDKPIGFIVNQFIYGPEKISNGNTGIFSYGYADLGVMGVIMVALVLSYILILVDSITSKLPVSIPVVAMSYQMISLNDTNLLINLLTGGIIITLILLYILNSCTISKIEGDY